MDQWTKWTRPWRVAEEPAHRQVPRAVEGPGLSQGMGDGCWAHLSHDPSALSTGIEAVSVWVFTLAAAAAAAFTTI